MFASVRRPAVPGLALVAVVGVLWVMCAGCGGTPGSGGKPGTVRGKIVGVGGPPRATPQSMPGDVVVSRDGDAVARQHVAEGAGFRFRLAPGRYRLAVTGTGAACEPVDVTVAIASDHALTLTCQRK